MGSVLRRAGVFGSICGWCLLTASSAFAKDFYVDPEKGDASGDGSAQKPWKTLEAVVAAKLIEAKEWESYPYAAGKKLVVKNAGAPIKAGDTVILRTGSHGKVNLVDYYVDQPITFQAEAGADVRLSQLTVTAGKNLHFVGLHVSTAFAEKWSTATLVSVSSAAYQGPASDIVIESCLVESLADASKWTMSDWDTLSANGISVRGDHVTVRKNTVRNVNFGIVFDNQAPDGVIADNVVDTFAGDGMRGLGDRDRFEGNFVKNALQVNANHSDGFQSWSVGADGKPGTGDVQGIVLRGNFFLNKEKTDLPFAAGMQGIGCFDGTYTDFVIENNVIISDTYHGISLYGAKNARIVNNTVLRRDATQKAVPWIGIFDHKNGTKAQGSLVRNNLTAKLSLVAGGATEDHNPTVKDIDWPALFADVATFDYHLVEGATAIDAGSADQAPATDHDGVARPQGAGVDLGAYEWSAAPAAGGGSGASGAAGAGTAGAAGNAATGGTAGAGTAGAGAGTAGGSTGGGNGGTAAAGGAGAGAGASAGTGGSGSAGAPVGAAGNAGTNVAGASAAGSAGSAGNAANDGAAVAADDGGCGCRLVGGAETRREGGVGSTPRASAALLLAAFGLCVARRRRNAVR
jgi:parallel beta-helix repeat protein